MNRRVAWGVALALVLLDAGTSAGQFGRSRNKAKVDFLASVERVSAGQPFDVALRFKLSKQWHIYWKNPGDAGQPPRVTWTLPDGFSAGALQFPVPKRHHDAGDITTNILEGEPALLVRITPPEKVAEQRVTLEGSVKYLICKDLCLQERASVKLELPVWDAQGAGKPANADLFDRARAALPSDSSKYVSVAPVLAPRELSPGQKFKLGLAIDVAKGHHIQSHKPSNPAFIKCDIYLERSAGIYFEDPIYPPPKMRTIQYLGQLSEFSGRFVVRIPGEVSEDASPGPVDVGGLLTYQACNDKGTCFPPDALAFSIKSAGLIKPAAGASAEPEPGDPTTAEMSAGVTVAPPGGSGGSDSAEGAGPGAATDEGSGGTDPAGGGQVPGFLGRFGIVGLLIACFLYGLVLNATPCVLPLLSIKVMGFVQQAHESRRRTLVLGLSFGVGVMVFFVLLGFLAAMGKNVLQSPAAVIVLGAVVMALALSMLGVYTLQVPTAATTLEASISKEGPLSSFGKGALAPVLGFACTGPALAFAFAWATQKAQDEPLTALLAFLFAGLGMASPYMLLGAKPHWLSFLPKPGNWMITFERIMGFVLLAMVVLLIHPLITHIGPEGLEWTLGFFVAIAMACWVLGKVNLSMSASQRWRYRAGSAGIVVAAGMLVYGWIYPLSEAKGEVASFAGGDDWSVKIPWRPWSIREAVRSGKTVFVDFTSAYCTNCKANKAVAINTPQARAKMKALGVFPMRGDFTSGDPEIFAELQKHGRAGVPLNLIYPAGDPDNPIVMPPLFGKEELLHKLDEAGPSSDAPGARAGS